MANELKPWKYDIQYGPEGEANYAWVYDDRGDMIATMKTHKAKEIVERMNTRPAAPVEGLETVEYQVEKNGKWYSDHPQSWGVRKNNGATVRRLCDQSQADAIIAARDARIEFLKRVVADQETQIVKQSTLEADNAALTARVKEETARGDKVQARLTAMSKTILRLRDVLILVTDHIEDDGDRAYFGSSNDADTLKDVVEELDGWAWDDIISDGKLPDVYETSRNAINRAEALETQLAAAMKALELIDRSVSAGRFIAIRKIARATLEAQP